jgi:TFIIF-interacting CTD phosphatase-like protein
MKTVIVDNILENFYLHVENGIEIKSWYDDRQDRKLFELGEILDGLVGMDDIREGIKKVPKLL